jgi:deazaflavin-dependent oxidoreductase (nitroreductase family)
MTERAYRKPPWMARTIGARLAARFNSAVSRLSVRGRTTGRWRTVSVAVLEYDGQRYLLAPAGDTDWSRNLRASGHGHIESRGRIEDITTIEVPVEQRPPLIEAYLRRYGKMPSVARTFRALPDPAHHPTFLITSTRPR